MCLKVLIYTQGVILMNYTRVSTNGQKDDLKNQIEFLLNFTSSKGIIVDETLRI